MHAAVLHEVPGDLVIEDLDVDKPGPRELLVRTATAGVCHSDLHFMEGKWPSVTPAVLGHESAGVVEAVGDEVTYVKPGDHVITCVSVFCGECEACLTGHPALCRAPGPRRDESAPPRLTLKGKPVMQFAQLGSFAEQMLVHERAVVKIPEDIPLDRAALVGCAVITGVGAVFNTAKVTPGSTVAVIGCGGIGLNCVQGAALAGAARIIAIDRVAGKLKMAEQFGATDMIDASATDPVAAVKDLTGGGVHYSFEAIGLKVTAEQAFRMLRLGGTATVVGMLPAGTKVEVDGAELLAEKRLQGCVMGSNRFRIDMPRLLDFYRQGRLKLDELVSARVDLSQINQAYENLKTGELARSVIVFN
jgi:S-(hydroxymethyl)glutathione dehydrogenase/alcohol dehydrogenase